MFICCRRLRAWCFLCVSAVLWHLAGLVFATVSTPKAEETSVQEQDAVLLCWSSYPAQGSFPWQMRRSLYCCLPWGWLQLQMNLAFVRFCCCGAFFFIGSTAEPEPSSGESNFLKCSPSTGIPMTGEFCRTLLIQPSPLSWGSAGLISHVPL